MAERCADDWDGVIAGLEVDYEKAGDALAALDVERAPLPLAVSLGNQGAVKLLAALDKARADARVECERLHDALAGARHRRAAAAQAEVEAATAGRLVQAREVARQIVALDRDKVLPGFALAAEGLRERAALIQQLRPLGELDTTRLRKLQNGAMLLGGLHRVGLGDHLPLTRIAPQHQMPIDEWDSRLLRGLLDPEATVAAEEVEAEAEAAA